MDNSKLVLVQTFGSRPEADLAKGLLEDAGIRAMLSADTAGRMREHLAWSGAGFEVFVREEDLPAAKEVLAVLSSPDIGTDIDAEPSNSPQSDDARPPSKRFS